MYIYIYIHTYIHIQVQLDTPRALTQFDLRHEERMQKIMELEIVVHNVLDRYSFRISEKSAYHDFGKVSRVCTRMRMR